MMAHKKKNLNTFLIVCASLAIGFFAGYLTGFRYGIKLSKENFSPPPPQSFPSEVPRLNLSSEALEIIKELNCICGCQMELLPCTCDEPGGSREIKLFVQRWVDEGLTKPEVVEKAVEKYGSAVLKKNS
ncbi:MAG: hypothetical protein ACE5L7_07690 [Candidatus Aminicenantales bacterium]